MNDVELLAAKPEIGLIGPGHVKGRLQPRLALFGHRHKPDAFALVMGNPILQRAVFAKLAGQIEEGDLMPGLGQRFTERSESCAHAPIADGADKIETGDADTERQFGGRHFANGKTRERAIERERTCIQVGRWG